MNRATTNGDGAIMGFVWELPQKRDSNCRIMSFRLFFKRHLELTPNCGCFGSGGHSETRRAKVGLVIGPGIDFAKRLNVFSLRGHQVDFCADGKIIIRDHIGNCPSIGRQRRVRMMTFIGRNPLGISTIQLRYIDVMESFFPDLV